MQKLIQEMESLIEQVSELDYRQKSLLKKAFVDEYHLENETHLEMKDLVSAFFIKNM